VTVFSNEEDAPETTITEVSAAAVTTVRRADLHPVSLDTHLSEGRPER
jgi:hypothetical protein